MKTLYLDTAYNQVIGICDERGKWLGLNHSSGQRSSASLHSSIYTLCKENGVDTTSIRRVIYLAGPGFYTGLRIGYGVAQIMKLTGVSVQSFFAFDIPSLLGKSNYKWITKAYRGEVFIYSSSDKSSLLMSEADFLSRTWDEDIYIHHPAALDEQMKHKLENAISTESLITENFSVIQDWLSSNNEVELHYFRAPEEEFRPNP